MQKMLSPRFFGPNKLLENRLDYIMTVLEHDYTIVYSAENLIQIHTTRPLSNNLPGFIIESYASKMTEQIEQP